MEEAPYKKLNAPDLGPCICSQVRKLARKLSSLYDTVLAPEKLTVTQYSLLANIARAGQLRHTVLAEKVGMDRTTFDRALADDGLRDWIVDRARDAQARWHVTATPSFVINGKLYAGAMSANEFAVILGG